MLDKEEVSEMNLYMSKGIYQFLDKKEMDNFLKSMGIEFEGDDNKKKYKPRSKNFLK